MNFKDNFTKGAKALLRQLRQLTGTHVTERDAMLPADEFEVKRKLGRSFFTRRLSPGTRYARIMGLTRAERDIAESRGWI